MANRVPRSTIDGMFAVYLDRQSVQEVARKYQVSHRTVERYRRLERWDQRVNEIRAKAQHEADYTIAEALAGSLRMIRAFKTKLAEAIERKRVTTDDVNVADLERLVRLEAFVLGASESRHEVVTEFSGWSDEEVERFARTGQSPGETSAGTP